MADDDRPEARDKNEVDSLAVGLCNQYGFGQTRESREEFRQGVIDALQKRPKSRLNGSYIDGYELGTKY